MKKDHKNSPIVDHDFLQRQQSIVTHGSIFVLQQRHDQLLPTQIIYNPKIKL